MLKVDQKKTRIAEDSQAFNYWQSGERSNQFCNITANVCGHAAKWRNALIGHTASKSRV